MGRPAVVAINMSKKKRRKYAEGIKAHDKLAEKWGQPPIAQKSSLAYRQKEAASTKKKGWK